MDLLIPEDGQSDRAAELTWDWSERDVPVPSRHKAIHLY